MSCVSPSLFRLVLAFGALVVLWSAPARAQESAQDRTAGTQPAAEKPSDPADTYRQLNLFGDVFERVRAQYVDPVEDKKLVETAINGMLTSLDPHSSYLDDEGFKDMQIQTKGEFGGLGIEVTMENGFVKVVSPIDDTPAFRAGLKTGDYITHLDGEPVMGLTLNQAVDKMRGKVGTSIELTVRRPDVQEPIVVKITRDIIKIRSVRSKTYEDRIGYIRITTFNQYTQEGVDKAIEDIKKALGNKLEGYVLDLRNNPGGLYDQAVSVADTFLDKGEIVSTRGRKEKDTKRDNATSGDSAGGLPIVVLINGGSASASEIVAGALQDHRRAILLGTKSFGKGSVQSVIPLPGYGAMRLTTARYYTPSGRSIQAKGIDPDILVEPAKVEEIDSKGLSEADLPGALDKDRNAPKKPDDKAPAKDAAKTPDASGDARTSPESSGPDAAKDGAATPEDDLRKDYQLSRAVDLLRGLSMYRGSMDQR